MKKILIWYWKLVKDYKSKYKVIHLSECNDWNISFKKIEHKSRLFFSIIGLKTKIINKKNNHKVWAQPFLKEKDFSGGILGLITTKIKNEVLFLVQGKYEPGNIYGVQISPTVQSTFSSIQFNKKKITYLDFFISKKFKKNIIFKKWVSEDGGRFYKKKNLVMIYNLKKKSNIKRNKNFMWINKNDLIKLNNYSKPIVNPHIRTLMSFILSEL